MPVCHNANFEFLEFGIVIIASGLHDSISIISIIYSGHWKLIQAMSFLMLYCIISLIVQGIKLGRSVHSQYRSIRLISSCFYQKDLLPGLYAYFVLTGLKGMVGSSPGSRRTTHLSRWSNARQQCCVHPHNCLSKEKSNNKRIPYYDCMQPPCHSHFDGA